MKPHRNVFAPQNAGALRRNSSELRGTMLALAARCMLTGDGRLVWMVPMVLGDIRAVEKLATTRAIERR